MSRRRFEYFVILAGMRTGSNLLEEHLASMPGIRTHGELFNPNFFGKPKAESQFGMTIRDRDQAPLSVIDLIKEQGPVLPGFRLFYDHDLRVVDHVLADEKAAKIILTRRPIESYVSLKVARATGQWWLGDLATARNAKVTFDAEEYDEFRETLSAFQSRVRKSLQTSGQTAFFVDYEELADREVIDGIGTFLGAEGPANPGKVKAKVQNPSSLADRLNNPEDAEKVLSEDEDLNRVASHEPGRGPGVRSFVAGQSVPLLYMPIRGAGSDPIEHWMKQLDPEARSGLSQKEVRQWLIETEDHRCFTVVRHPLARAYDAFCENILPVGPGGTADIRAALVTRYGVPLPESAEEGAWTLEDQQHAFLMFLRFLKGNLGGQTSIRVDRSWASQEALYLPMARFVAVDRLVRENLASEELDQMVGSMGIQKAPPVLDAERPTHPFPLSLVRTTEIENACAQAYKRDFAFFGFRPDGN